MKRLVLAAMFLEALPFAGQAQSQFPAIHLVAPAVPTDARLMGFSFTITAGRVAALADCPADWQISINNTASWQATITARATVGAASLSVRALETLFSIEPPPPDIAADLQSHPVAVKGSITVMRHGDLKTIPTPTLHLVAVSAAGLDPAMRR